MDSSSRRNTAWLKKRDCRNIAAVAQKAVDAAHTQRTMLATQAMGSALATKLAAESTVIDHELVDLGVTEKPTQGARIIADQARMRR